ncbi:MAG: beta-lactamase family protein [Bacteroidetes bacterium]|nr:beta-lactamase family protein [Bacteroidota bacterium]
MLKSIFFSVFLLFFLALQSQVNTAENTEMAGKIKNCYNSKKYSEIYTFFSLPFKSKMSGDEFTGFMEKNIFLYHHQIKNFEFLRNENLYSLYLMHFSNDDLLMRLNVNDSNQIDLLQFLPDEPQFKTKINEYGSDNLLRNGMDSMIDKVVRDYMQSPQNCGLSIGISQNGKKYFYNYGEIKRRSKKSPSPSTIYEIGSLTKVFCGILFAQAVIEKKVKPTDDIRLYLPKGNYANLETSDHYIQLIHLANHTSGLPRIPENLKDQAEFDPLNPYKHYSRQLLFSYLEHVKLSTEPGSISEYSNLGMGLLGIILENVYGKPFEELITAKICQPYLLNNTRVILNSEQEPLLAQGYNAGGTETPSWELNALVSAGGLKSTINDMITFLEKNIDEKNEALKLSQQPTFNKGTEMAMGWQLLKTKSGNTLTWHNGGTYGSSSFCGFIKEKNCAVAVLSNSGTTVDPIALAILRFLQK